MTQALVRVYTLQPPQAVRRLRAGRPFYAWQSRSPHEEDFAVAYPWMREQYTQRTGIALRRGRGLIWVWKKKPDLRSYFLPAPAVRLTLDVDPNRILWSSYDHWHRPLNRSPVQPPNLLAWGKRVADLDWDDPRYLAYEEAYEAWYESLPPQSVQSTWSRIFDPRYFGGEGDMQGVMGGIYPNQVRRVEWVGPGAKSLRKRARLNSWEVE